MFWRNDGARRSDPPTPLPSGSQRPAQHSRSTPCSQTYMRALFDPEPSAHALRAENRIPRASKATRKSRASHRSSTEPSAAAFPPHINSLQVPPATPTQAIASTWDSVSQLAVSCEYHAFAGLALVGLGKSAKGLARVGLVLVLVSNPRLVYRTMDAWWTVLKHPWKWSRHVGYTFILW